MLLIYASAWLTVCAIWVAFTRRRTVHLFLMTLAFNGLLVAVFGITQRLIGNGKIYWFYASPNDSFFSTFIYKNHAGSYLDLALAITCGLASWSYLRGLRRLEKSNPSGVLAFFATCIALAIVTSYARGATLVMLVFALGCCGSFIAHQFTNPKEGRKPIIALALMIVFGCLLKTGFDTVSIGHSLERLQQGITRKDGSLLSRERATAASIEMLRKNWHVGVGAGSFRVIFPIYQHRDPELVTSGGRRLFWEHAHNDVVQFPIELGAIGCGLLVIGGCYWLFLLTKAYFWEDPLSCCLIFGAVLLLAYAWWDFPFQCPAILITWCAMWPAATMSARFKEGGAKT
jgi:hypothetical protein